MQIEQLQPDPANVISHTNERASWPLSSSKVVHTDKSIRQHGLVNALATAG
jgi:hypothetical protein